MPSFDIVSKVDPQVLDNAINVVRKEITNRFDFKGVAVKIELNKKEMKVDLEAESEMQIKQIVDVVISRSMKQGLDPLAFDFSKEPYQSGKVVRKEISVRNGLSQDDAKKVTRLIKDSGLKVQAQIMDDLVRVTAKKIDDLQAIIKLSGNANLGMALQFINMRS
jgi:cyclic-di-GMP-binding protein